MLLQLQQGMCEAPQVEVLHQTRGRVMNHCQEGGIVGADATATSGNKRCGRLGCCAALPLLLLLLLLLLLQCLAVQLPLLCGNPRLQVVVAAAAVAEAAAGCWCC
jgi:hypothetical protein